MAAERLALQPRPGWLPEQSESDLTLHTGAIRPINLYTKVLDMRNQSGKLRKEEEVR